MKSLQHNSFRTAIITGPMTGSCRYRFLAKLILFSVLFSFASCGNDSSGIKLDGQWEYRAGFNKSWLKSYESHQWEAVAIPHIFLTPDSPAYSDPAGGIRAFTLRKELPPETLSLIKKKVNLSFHIPNLTGHVIDFYINEKSLGAIGSAMPYHPAMSRTYLRPIPCDILDVPGKKAVYIVFNILKFDRVSHGIYETPVIGNTSQLFGDYFFEQTIDFVLITIYISIGMIFVVLGLRLGNHLYSLYFGLFALCFTFFEMSNLSCRELIFGQYVLVRLKVDQISLKLLIASFALFITLLFKKKHTRLSLVIAAYCLALAFCDIFRGLEQTLDDRYNFWHLAVAVGFPYVLVIMIREALKKNIDALIMIAGVFLFTVSSVQNILEDAHIIESSKIPLHYTVLGIFLSVVAMLINRFAIIHKEINHLNLDLEQKVEERTRELQKASEKIILMKRKEKFLQSFNLTDREREILGLIMEGQSAGDISISLDLSLRTVNNHIYNLYQKMGVHSRMEIISVFDKITL